LFLILSKPKSKRTKRSGPTQLYSIISVALVLFLLGSLMLLLLNASAIGNTFKDNFRLSLILQDQLKEADILRIQQEMESSSFVQSVSFISKTAAKNIFERTIGEGFDEILGYNPLYASLDLGLAPDYIRKDSLDIIKAELESRPEIQEVHYQQDVLELVNRNFNVLGLVLAAISFLFLLIAFTLIDNTIRLMMYSKRFLVKSMQLVGATRSFITGPFMRQSLANGLYASIIAIFLLGILLIVVQSFFPDFQVFRDLLRFGLVSALLILLGLMISFWSTRRSVSKYIKMKLDDLY